MRFRQVYRLGLAAVPSLFAAWSVAQAGEPHPLLVEMNEELAAIGAEYRVEIVEYITIGEDFQTGRTIFASDRGNKQRLDDFVPGDPRRGGGTDITWIIDRADLSSTVPGGAEVDAIRRAMATWKSVPCSDIPLIDLGETNVSVGVAQFLFGFGSFPGVIPDLAHAGFLPGGFFDLLAPGGSTFILGATFTFVFTGPTDIDGNGKDDVAFREIYYNDAFPWAIDTNFPIDVESIALHESGHGLSQTHFGDISQIDANGRIVFAPRSVMNAIYSGVQQELTGTDLGGHCSNWANWPHK